MALRCFGYNVMAGLLGPWDVPEIPSLIWQGSDDRQC